MDLGPRSRSQKVLSHWRKKFKDRHRGYLSRSRVINVKQSESRAKVPPPDGRMGRLKKEHCAGGTKTSSFNWGSGDMKVSPGELG
jgi:hypothetical protein